MKKIIIVKEPSVFGPEYVKEALVGLTLEVDEKTQAEENTYAVKKENVLKALENKGDIIALGWWEEHFWPQKENWLYLPKECCREIS